MEGLRGVSAHVSVAKVRVFASKFKYHSREASWACVEKLNPYQPFSDAEFINRSDTIRWIHLTRPFFLYGLVGLLHSYYANNLNLYCAKG
jgi:hypothetical protein